MDYDDKWHKIRVLDVLPIVDFDRIDLNTKLIEERQKKPQSKEIKYLFGLWGETSA